MAHILCSTVLYCPPAADSTWLYFQFYSAATWSLHWKYDQYLNLWLLFPQLFNQSEFKLTFVREDNQPWFLLILLCDSSNTCRKTLRKHSKYNQYDQYGQIWLREFYFTWIQKDSSQLCAATSLILLQTYAVFYCGFYSGFCSRASSRSDQYHHSQINFCNDGLQPVLLHTQSACSCVCFYSVLLVVSTVGGAGLWHHQSRLCFRSSDRSVG